MMKKYWILAMSVLGFMVLLIWYSVLSYSGNTVKIIACDVGQGDAFLITQKNFQLVIDGGPNNNILQCLSDNMPFWDRVVDVVILSHPQKDHFAGLIDVFEAYEVKYFLTTPLDSGSKEWGVLKDLVGGRDTKVINPKEGDKYGFGLIYLDILWPTSEFLAENLIVENNNLAVKQSDNSTDILGVYTSLKDPNEFSVVLIVSYKNFDALFTGDIGPSISDMLAEEFILSDNRRFEYIKVPHHGSKNGLTKNLLDALEPKVAVISVGKGNSYGHPHEETLKILGDKEIRILRTDEVGEVIVETDGENIILKN